MQRRWTILSNAPSIALEASVRRPIIWSVIAGATLLYATRVSGAEANVLVGVLEDTPAVAPGERSKARVRVVFRHTAAGGWEAYPNDCIAADCLKRITTQYPPRMTWAISRAGLTVGSVAARTPAAFRSNQEIGLQEITSKGPIPFIGKPSTAYAGAVGEPVRRPLLATSSVRKPQRSLAGWEEGSPDPEDLDRVWPAFRRLVPLVDNCPAAEAPPADSAVDSDTHAASRADAEVAPGRHPQKLDLDIPTAWVARSGEALLRVVVRPEIYVECDGPRAYPSQVWFHRDATGRVHALPGQLADDRAELGAPLEFIDLLRDGHDEVLFQAAGHERGGYVLYYDRLQKSVAQLWAYH